MPRTSPPAKSTPKVSLPLPPPVLYQPRPQSLMTSVKEGFGLGIGASLGRTLVDSVFSSKPPASQATPASPNNTQTFSQSSNSENCKKESFAFDSCIRSFPSDITTCQSQLDALNRCFSMH